MMCIACVPVSGAGDGKTMVTSVSPRPSRNSALATSRITHFRRGADGRHLSKSARGGKNGGGQERCGDQQECASNRQALVDPEVKNALMHGRDKDRQTQPMLQL